MAQADSGLRAQVEALFDAELRVLPKARRNDVLDALDVMTSFEVWDRMRINQALTTRAVRRIVAGAVTRLLDNDDDSAGPSNYWA